MIALSVYGSPSDARYNAVWVQRPGGAWLGVPRCARCRLSRTLQSGGCVGPSAGTGERHRRRFERHLRRDVRSRHTWSVDGAARPRSCELRGREQPGHAGRDGVAFHDGVRRCRVAALRRGVARAARGRPPAPARTRNLGRLSSGLRRRGKPAILSAARSCRSTEDHRLAAAFSNDNVGRWVARHGLTASAYQREFDSNVANGLFPICIDAGGVGSSVRFAAIFAERDIPHARQWSVTGRRPVALAATDALVESFMKQNSIRSAQLSIARNLTVRFERAYTWSEPGTRRTGVRDRMLLASNSKIFVTAAVQSLYDRLTAQRHVECSRPLAGFTRYLGSAARWMRAATRSPFKT